MRKRLSGENTTLINRKLSFDSVPTGKRCNQIIEVLEDIKSGTAIEIAKELYNRGYIKHVERNATAPRLSELSDEGIVEPLGSKKDEIYGKEVAVYGLTEMYKQERTFNYDTVTLQDIEKNDRFIFECDGDNKRLVLKKEF